MGLQRERESIFADLFMEKVRVNGQTEVILDIIPVDYLAAVYLFLEWTSG